MIPHSSPKKFAPSPQQSTLSEVIQAHQPLPPYSLMLGQCEDNSPLLMDLFNPQPGSVLILGDDPQANRTHLRTILESLYLLNDAHQVQVHLITPQADILAPESPPHLRGVFSPREQASFLQLSECFLLAERRMKEGRRRPVVVIAIDQLEQLLEEMEPQSLAFFRWLLRRGPSACVWTLATLSPGDWRNLDWKTVRAFGTFLFGNIQARAIPARLSDIPGELVAALPAGEKACMRLNDQLVQFSIPTCK